MTTQSSGDTAAAGMWLTTQEAMRRLGVSERTLFRRIARGRLQKRTRADAKIEVWVQAPLTVTEESPASFPHPATRDVSEDQRPGDAERALVIADRISDLLGRQVQPLLQEMTAMRQQLVTMAEENGRLKAEVRALTERLAPPVARPDGDRHRRRRWWQWWRR